MSPKTSARPKPTGPTRSTPEPGKRVLADDDAWVEGEAHEGSANDDGPDEASANQDGADIEAERRAARKRRREQADAEAEQGGPDGEPPGDAAELDPQLERAEGEGMVTEHAKVSATDPGPEPLPEPEPEPEPDHGPEDPDDEPD
jgi:hypothetical protein